jgi:MFS family permease
VIVMAEAPVAGGGLDRRRWLLLWVIGLAQLMVVLDLTVMNIALPSAQHALHFSTVDRQWVLTAYTLSFGSLPLLGGKLSDLLPGGPPAAAAPRGARPQPERRLAQLLRASPRAAALAALPANATCSR